MAKTKRLPASDENDQSLIKKSVVILNATSGQLRCTILSIVTKRPEGEIWQQLRDWLRLRSVQRNKRLSNNVVKFQKSSPEQAF